MTSSSKSNKYQLDTPVMYVDENSGIVKTMNELGRAHVSIVSTEDFDIVQYLDVPIEVKYFIQIMFS